MKAILKKYLTGIGNLPNFLTLLRLLMIPAFVWVFVLGLEKTALAIFLAASFTDFLDGYLARKWNQVTNFGKLMDPVADKVMVVTALICQGVSGVMPWVAIAVVMLKELVLIVGGMVMLRHGIVVQAKMSGKIAQVCFIVALTLSFFHKEFASLRYAIDAWMLWIAVGMAFIALGDYLMDALKKFAKK